MYFLLKVYFFVILLNTRIDFIPKVLSKELNENSNEKNISFYIKRDLNSNETQNALIEPNFYGNDNQLNSKSFPSSFAILVNFGVDGRSRKLFSSKAGDQQCGDQQIWDPFNGHCRQLYCSAQFTLVGFKCVETIGNSESEDNITKPFVPFLDSSAQFVNITLGFKLQNPIPDVFEWIDSQHKTFEDEFITQFADSFAKLSTQRITNVSFSTPKAPDILDISFSLLESNNTSNTNNDAILAVLTETVSQKALSFKLYDNTVTALSIHSTISELRSFCGNDTDMPLWYWNSQFLMSTEDNITYLYVNETGKKYKPGEYLGNILYVQNMDVSDGSDPNKVNVSSNAVVCEQTLIDENCTRILLNRSEYYWFSSNKTSETTLKTIYGQTYKHYELAPNGVFVCFQYQIEEWIQDLVEDILSTVLIIISISALTCVLITYLRFASLRSTISGFNTINLSLCLGFMQILFLVSPYVINCKIGAIFLHYLLLLSMSWSSVIAYDMYRTFGARRIKIRHKNQFKLKVSYWLTANTLAVIVVGISVVCEELDSDIKPDYGDMDESASCWIRNPWATFLFFGIPLIFNVILNLVLYIMTVFRVRVDLKTSDNLRKVIRIPSDTSSTSTISTTTTGSQSTTSTSSLSNTSRPNQVLIFTRLGVLMGFTWIIALIIALIPEKYETLLKALSYIFVVCNTSQGMVLFIAFLCNKKIIKLWKNSFKR